MQITKTLLIRKHACRKQVELFAKLFPGGVIVTKEICLQHAGKFNWCWAAHHLLPKPAEKAYTKAVAPAEKAYAEAVASVEKAYKRAVASAEKAYAGAMAIAFAEAAKEVHS